MNIILNKLYFGLKMKYISFCFYVLILIVNRDCRNYDKFKCEILIFVILKYENKI